MLIKIKVNFRASQNKIIHEGEIFKIKVTTAPERGQANEMVIKLLAKEFKVAKSQIEIVKGLTQRNKLVKINNNSTLR